MMSRLVLLTCDPLVIAHTSAQMSDRRMYHELASSTDHPRDIPERERMAGRRLASVAAVEVEAAGGG